jgi:hypothetical protein
MVDTVGNVVGGAWHGARSTDHAVANTPNIAGTANTVDIAGTELHPNMGQSNKGHMPVPEGRGYPRQAKPAV